MDQPTATLIASIVAAVGSATVGVTAVMFSWRTSRAALRQQEQLIAAEKLWERRADTYVDLMKAVNTVTSKEPDPRTGRVPKLNDLLDAGFFARLSAYDKGTVERVLFDHIHSRNGAGLQDLQESVHEALGMRANDKT